MATLTKTRKLDRLARIVGEFRKLDASMPAGVMTAFLRIAAQPGCSTAEVADAVGMSQASASRCVQALCKDYLRHGKPAKGADLVTNTLDPLNGRRRIINLTPKGKAVAATLMDLIGD